MLVCSPFQNDAGSNDQTPFEARIYHSGGVPINKLVNQTSLAQSFLLHNSSCDTKTSSDLITASKTVPCNQRKTNQLIGTLSGCLIRNQLLNRGYCHRPHSETESSEAWNEEFYVRDWSLIMGRGGATKREGGGHVKFYSYEKGGWKKF